MVASNGVLLSNNEVDAIKLLRDTFTWQCNLEDRKLALLLVRIGKATDLITAMSLVKEIKQTFTWID